MAALTDEQRSWAGERGDDFARLIVACQRDITLAGRAHAFRLDEAIRDGVPTSIDIPEAVADLVAWRIQQLRLENTLRRHVYYEPAIQRSDVVSEYLDWSDRHLSMSDEDRERLHQLVGLLVFSLLGNEKVGGGLSGLWRLAAEGIAGFTDTLVGVMQRVLPRAAQAGADGFLEQFAPDVTFDLVDTGADAALREYALSFSKRTAAGSEEQIRKRLLRSVNEGHTPAETADAVMEERASLWRYEAERIARTETVRAHSMGQLDAMADLGYKTWIWITHRDERTCLICGPRNGIEFKIGDPPPPAHPNCRCSPGAPAEATESILDLILVGA